MMNPDFHVMRSAADYALRALVVLACAEGPVICGALARQEKLPAHYVAKLLQNLARRGILLGVKGAKGGFSLLKPANEITVFEVLQVVQPAKVPAYYPERLRNTILSFLRDTTIADLVREDRRRRKGMAAA